ncbi:hypothetical protein AB9M62_25665 [Bacillales bacterium AN1005]
MKYIFNNFVYGVGVVLLMIWGLNNINFVMSCIDAFTAFMASWSGGISSLTE